MSDLISRDDAIRELNGACSSWEDDAKVQEIVMAIPSAKPTGDLISRADAIEAVIEYWDGYAKPLDSWDVMNQTRAVLETLPSADADRPKVVGIDYSPYRIQTTAPSADAVSRKAKCCPIAETCMSIDCPVSSEYIGRPSAEAVQGEWRTGKPTENGEYMVTLYAWGHRYIDVMHYAKPQMPNIEVDGTCWYRYDDEFGDVVYDDKDILAWMPLPTPYKGGDSE